MDGQIEATPLTFLSMTIRPLSEDNGAYVQAWVWVDFSGTQLDKEPT